MLLTLWLPANGDHMTNGLVYCRISHPSRPKTVCRVPPALLSVTNQVQTGQL